MAIYPRFRFLPQAVVPWFGEEVTACGRAVRGCGDAPGLNLGGIRFVGITSLWLFFLLSLPFALVVLTTPQIKRIRDTACAAARDESRSARGVMVPMWNYHGLDNARTMHKKWNASAYISQSS